MAKHESHVWLGYILVPKNEMPPTVFASLEAAKNEMPKLLAKRVMAVLGLRTPDGLHWSGTRERTDGNPRHPDEDLTLWWGSAHGRDFIRIERAEVLL